METLDTVMSKLTWESLWLYMVFICFIFALLKLSKLSDLWIQKLDAELRLAEAQKETEWRRQRLLIEEIDAAQKLR
jgi:hypothetical protein